MTILRFAGSTLAIFTLLGAAAGFGAPHGKPSATRLSPIAAKDGNNCPNHGVKVIPATSMTGSRLSCAATVSIEVGGRAKAGGQSMTGCFAFVVYHPPYSISTPKLGFGFKYVGTTEASRADYRCITSSTFFGLISTSSSCEVHLNYPVAGAGTYQEFPCVPAPVAPVPVAPTAPGEK